MTTSTSPTARSLWRATRLPLLLAAMMAAVATISALLSGGDGGRLLDPDDASLRGGRALAQLLRASGVQVDRVDSPARAAALPGDRTVLITGNIRVNDPQALADLPGDLIVEATNPHLDLLAPGLDSERDEARERSREPDCALPAAASAGSAYLGGRRMRPPPGAVGCYPANGRPTLLAYRHEGRAITVLGSSSFLTNQRLDEDGNAALALTLLSGKPAVTWLVPPPAEPAGGQPAGPGGRAFHDLMPESVGWGLRMALIALLLTALWRARRLGPVVVERLPVVVRAAETIEGHSRLYRARRARGQAAAALRAGTLGRIVPRLGLSGDAVPAAVVAAAAGRTGEDPRRIDAALYGAAPADDGALVELARDLERLERQIIEH